MTRRQVRVALYIVFGAALATALLTLFVGGPAELGVPTAIAAVVLGGLIDSGYPWRKR